MVTDNTGTTCECKVFGTIAVIAEHVEDPSVTPEYLWLSIIKYVGFVLSFIFVLVFIFVVMVTRYG